jgi:uncharacterized protein YjiK
MVDKTPIKIIAIIVIPIVIAILVRVVTWDNSGKAGKESVKTEKTSLLDLDKKKDAEVLITWLLPETLLEVSGIAWLDADHFACVQDEMGTVFLFNVRLNKIDREIPFGPKGDYEGIAIVDKSLYVLRADGALFAIENFPGAERKVKMYTTGLKEKQDSESLTYDKKNNRLLIAVKGPDPNSSDYKGIYSFDLKSKSMLPTPVYKINLNDKIFEDVNKGKPKNSISPSDLAIHPTTGDLYILEGTKPKLLIMNKTGALLSLHELKGPDFPQPEGISFSPDGKMYISNEGNKGEGNILQVELSTK